jgi:hypothetical protein
MTKKTTICIDSLKTLPNIRQERMDAIKKAMVAGVHQVSSRQLADAMFSEFFAHRPATPIDAASIGRNDNARFAPRSQ